MILLIWRVELTISVFTRAENDSLCIHTFFFFLFLEFQSILYGGFVNSLLNFAKLLRQFIPAVHGS